MTKHASLVAFQDRRYFAIIYRDRTRPDIVRSRPVVFRSYFMILTPENDRKRPELFGHSAPPYQLMFANPLSELLNIVVKTCKMVEQTQVKFTRKLHKICLPFCELSFQSTDQTTVG